MNLWTVIMINCEHQPKLTRICINSKAASKSCHYITRKKECTFWEWSESIHVIRMNLGVLLLRSFLFTTRLCVYNSVVIVMKFVNNYVKQKSTVKNNFIIENIGLQKGAASRAVKVFFKPLFTLVNSLALPWTQKTI